MRLIIRFTDFIHTYIQSRASCIWRQKTTPGGISIYHAKDVFWGRKIVKSPRCNQGKALLCIMYYKIIRILTTCTLYWLKCWWLTYILVFGEYIVLRNPVICFLRAKLALYERKEVKIMTPIGTQLLDEGCTNLRSTSLVRGKKNPRQYKS